MATQPRTLSARKLDTVYFVFFLIHIPIMLLVDLAELLPQFLRSDLSTKLRSTLIEQFHDRFFVAPPAWFTTYMYLEAAYHLPISLWFVWAIPTDHPLVSLNLLIFALETAVTTLTCVVDISAWEPYTAKQKIDLYSIYVPYFVLACLMGVDAFAKIRKQILGSVAKGKTA